MTGTLRRSGPKGASRLLSLFSDSALAEVDREEARTARRRSASGPAPARTRTTPAGSRAPQARSAGASTTGARSTTARSTSGRSTSGRSTPARSASGRSTSARTTSGRSTPARSTSGRSTSARSTTVASKGRASAKDTRSAPRRAPGPTGPSRGPVSGRSTGRSSTPRSRSASGLGPDPTRRISASHPAVRSRSDQGTDPETWYDDPYYDDGPYYYDDVAPNDRGYHDDRGDDRGTRPTGTRSGGTRSSGSGRSTGTRSGSARATTARSTATRARTTSRSRPAATTVSGFRPRRRSSGQARRSGRKAHPPVTEVGERTAAYLTATVLGLTLFGLVMVLSASAVLSLHQIANSPFFQFKRQAMWAGLGAVAFVVASRIDYRRVRLLAGPLLVITIAMLGALLVPGLGHTENGSTRWLGVGPFVVQPSEVAKLVLIVFVADLLARRERRMDRPELTVRPIMLVLVMVSALIVVQPKLGTPIILSAVTLLMLFVAGARMRSLIPWVTVAVGAASVLAYVAPYRRNRLLAFLDPWQDPLGIGLQSIQSQVGIASGGLFGVGLGAGRAKWGFLPEAQSDFIFAIVAEEVGLIGASAMIGGFLLIAWFGIRTAAAAPDRFGTLLAAGITSWLLVQAFLNIGMVLGVLPITGEALPFVSAGGSSLVVTLSAAGLLTSVARRVRG